MTSPFKNQSFPIAHVDSGIKHREVRHSDDMELIEIISPAEFPTQEEDAP